jgi:hypothetical protein
LDLSWIDADGRYYLLEIDWEKSAMRIDFYTQVHKKQRKQMFALASYVGEANFSDSTILSTIEKDLTALLSELRNHTYHEETFIHPLLTKKFPRAAKVQHQEHDELKIILQELETNFSHLQWLTPQYVKSQEQGLEFYRSLNRFISAYLSHINDEEYTLQNLWEIAADPELRGMMTAFQIYDGVEKGKKWLAGNLPQMNSDERILMFKTTQLMAPEKIFNTMCELTAEIIGTEDWQAIQKKLGVAG